MEIVKTDTNTSTGSVTKLDGIFDKIKEDMLMEVIEGALPKIKPFLAPALEKFSEWFGEDDKLIIVKKNKGASIKVIILDNNKGDYEIRNGANKCFSVQKESVIGVYPIDDFMGKIISGEFSKTK